MHATVSQALIAGFQVTVASDITHAVKQALAWSEMHSALLRPLAAGD